MLGAIDCHIAAIYILLDDWKVPWKKIHKGDSDSTGTVAGNLIGAIVGYDAIPQYYKENLEFHDVILHVADDLYRGEISSM